MFNGGRAVTIVCTGGSWQSYVREGRDYRMYGRVGGPWLSYVREVGRAVTIVCKGGWVGMTIVRKGGWEGCDNRM